jgi:2-phospho-L-lactate transferase/gluconeogenesis factor (CofD/UPF0052 family)
MGLMSEHYLCFCRGQSPRGFEVIAYNESPSSLAAKEDMALAKTDRDVFSMLAQSTADSVVRIAILTGGTGSIALQRGLYKTFEEGRDGIVISVLVNAYDNGLSTGAVRYVMNGKILGPSDVRKNQATRLQLEDPQSPWLGFLSRRFTVDPHEARAFCHREVDHLISEQQGSGRDQDGFAVLGDAIDAYFKSPLALKIPYRDFALSNIVYAGLAHRNGNSLRAAARVMARALHIADNVLLNDDRSLFLGANTRAGETIADEGGIVSWGNSKDPIESIYFTDPDGTPDIPVLCVEAWQVLLEADLILLSSGTQWSSLIPTYASIGFSAAVRASKAEVVMVVNRTPDQDSPGQSVSDIIRAIVPAYFDPGRLHLLADNNAHPSMSSLDAESRSKVASFSLIDLSAPSSPPGKHDPTRLAQSIGSFVFREFIDSDLYLFDYDNTLCGKRNSFPMSSAFNVSGIWQLNAMTDVGICTGNTVRRLRLQHQTHAVLPAQTLKPLVVFADGGANQYECHLCYGPEDGAQRSEPVLCVAPETLFPTTGPFSAARIIEALKRVGLPEASLDNRGNALIAITPIDPLHSRAVVGLIQHLIRGSSLEVCETGETTIEIRSPALSKRVAILHLGAKAKAPQMITYVGDECDAGNDRDIKELALSGAAVKCLHVASPARTAFFIATLIGHLRNGNH